jgi:hypothetical protein
MSTKVPFSSKSSLRPRNRDTSLDAIGQPQHKDVTMTGTHSTSARILSSFRKFLHVHDLVDGKTQHVSVPTSSSPQPTPRYQSESPAAAKQTKAESAPSCTLTSPPTTANSGLSPPSTMETAPTTLGSTTATDLTHKVDPDTEYKSAIEGFRDAEKLLERRHAAVKTRPELRAAPKKSDSPKSSTRNELSSNSRVTALPCHPSVPSYRQGQTAQEACDALQRRLLFRDLAYRATHGCIDASSALQKLNAHYALKARHQGTSDIPDLILNFDGIHAAASQLRSVERNWVSRHITTRKLQSLEERKQLGVEDCEQIVEQLFPTKAKDILEPEHFEIYLTGLAKEGIITASEVKSIAHLGVSLEEFEAGARWSGGHNNKGKHRHSLSTLAIFDIPKDNRRSLATSSTTRGDLNHHLRILIEAAVYDQKFWKGFFFPNARSKLQSFYDAHLLQQQGLPTPPNLTDYKRPWTYRDTRLLQRGHLVCTLLHSFEAKHLDDFGMVRAIRATFICLPGQAYWDVEDLTTFLYHRITNSGLPLSQIPDIIALHPEHDVSFANKRQAASIVNELQIQTEEFGREEEMRLRDIETSISRFEAVQKSGMSRWDRMKMKVKKLFGRKEDRVAPFDPFAEA